MVVVTPAQVREYLDVARAAGATSVGLEIPLLSGTVAIGSFKMSAVFGPLVVPGPAVEDRGDGGWKQRVDALLDAPLRFEDDQ